MHTFRAVAVVAAFAVNAFALPSFGFGAGNGCLTKHSAYALVKDFIQLSNGNEFNVSLAKEILTEDVVDTSGSVASIIDGGATGPVPLLGPTLGNRSDFIAANSAQASTPYKPLNIYWTCDVITFRFVINFTQPVLGITILETISQANNKFKIKQIYGELNSLAFAIDTGFTVTPPPPASAAAKRGLGIRF